MTPRFPENPRRVSFDYPQDMKPIWTPARPEFSCAANSVSLMMPSIEPYFVRSARSALPKLQEPLRSEAQAYVAQEAQHHNQHLRFNRMLLESYPFMRRFERGMKRVYRALERTGSQQFNLGFAAASETMAYSAARWAADNRTELFTAADDVASTLFLWHLAEEVEHKSVAHDIYWAMFAAKPRAKLFYTTAMAVALALVVLFVVAGTAMMLFGERRLHNPIAWLRLIRWSIAFSSELLSNLAVSLLPGHHPSNFADPLWYEVWLRELDAESGTLPIWRSVP